MKHYKGLLCGLAAVVLVLGAVRIVSLNKALPSPEDKPVTVGEKFIYKGLEGTVGDVEIYNKEEMQTAYPDIELEVDGLDDSHISDSTYIVANVKMTNNTQDTVYMGKTGVAQWILEAGLNSNGVDAYIFSSLNPDYSRTFQAGDSEEIKLVYTIWSDYMTKEELEKSPLKVVYSYYPGKNYIYYEGKN